MRVRGQLQLLDRGLEQPTDDELADELTGVWTHEVRTEELPVAGVPDHLHEPFRLAHPPRPPVGAPREAPDRDLEPLAVSCFLGEPDRRDLGVAVGHARNVRVVDGHFAVLRDCADGRSRLRPCLVRQERRLRDVADRVDPGNVRAHPCVGRHKAAIYPHADLLEADAVHDRRAPDRD